MLSRAEFIKATEGSFFQGFFPALPVVAPAIKRVVLCETFVNDPRTMQATHWQHKLHAGSALVLKREAENPRHAQALALYTRQGLKLGYLRRAIGTFAALLMDQGLAIRACILSADPGAPLWERISVCLFLDFPA